MKKLIYSSLVMMVIGANLVFASGENDAERDRVTGPGVGLTETYETERIYGYGSLITGTENFDLFATTINDGAPTTVENTISNPINNYVVDMGPTSNYYASNYVEHSIDDNGPGTGITKNTSGKSIYYGGGPGAALVSALNGTEEVEDTIDISAEIYSKGPTYKITATNNGEGPTVSTKTVSPTDYLSYISLTPKEASVDVVNRKNKNYSNSK